MDERQLSRRAMDCTRTETALGFRIVVRLARWVGRPPLR